MSQLNNWLILLIAPLVLIESRELLQGCWSLPAVTSLLLILLGADAAVVLPTAFLVHICYHQRTASGAVLYPEYAYAFWLVCGLGGGLTAVPAGCRIGSLALLLLLIKGLAAAGAGLIRLKRGLLGRYLPVGDQAAEVNGKVPSVSFLLSYLLFFFPAWIFSIIANSISLLIPQTVPAAGLVLTVNLGGTVLLLWFARRLFLEIYRNKQQLIFYLSGVLLALLLSLII